MKKKIILVILVFASILLSIYIFLNLHSDSFDRSYDFILNFKKADILNLPTNKYINDGFKRNLKGKINKYLKSAISIIFSEPDINIRGDSEINFKKDTIESGAYRIVFKPEPKRRDTCKIDFRKNGNNYLRFGLDLFPGGSIKLILNREGKTEVLYNASHDFKQDENAVAMLLFYSNRILLLNPEEVLLDLSEASIPSKGTTEVLTMDNSAGIINAIKFATMSEQVINLIEENRLRKQSKSITSKPLDFDGKIISRNLLHIYHERISRRAIALPAGSEIGFTIRIPEEATLEYEYLSRSFSDERTDRPFLSLQMTQDDNKTNVEQNMPPESEDEWARRRIDISRFGGRSTKIEFRVIPAENGNPEDQIIFLANPVIRRIRREEGKNVLIIMLDTLAADHLGCYGYKRDTSPNIDSFAGRGVLFKNTISQAPWTLPAHFSLFTSLYPTESGFEHFKFNRDLKIWNAYLIPSIKTLAEYLIENGYKTTAITEDGFVSALFGFDQGFEVYMDTIESNQALYDPEKYLLNKQASINTAADRHGADSMIDYTADICCNWIEDNRNYKWFIFYHTYEIHAPYRRRHFQPDSADGVMADVIANYDSGIWYADDRVGRIIKKMESLDLLKNTLVIITSDHGESFYNRKTGKPEGKEVGRHGHNLYDPLLKVPLIMGGGDIKPQHSVIENQVRLVDLLPTILEFAGITVPEQIRGKNLIPLIENEEDSARLAYSEGLNVEAKFEKKSLRTDANKLIMNPSNNPRRAEFEFYDLKSDPLEIKNIYSPQLKEAFNLKNVLEKIIRSINQNRKKIKNIYRTDGENLGMLHDKLRALGYLNN